MCMVGSLRSGLRLDQLRAIGSPGIVRSRRLRHHHHHHDQKPIYWYHKNSQISTNIQRQKLSIAAFEAAHEGLACSTRPGCFPIKRPPKSNKVPPKTECRPGWGTSALAPNVPGYMTVGLNTTRYGSSKAQHSHIERMRHQRGTAPRSETVLCQEKLA